jgi:hypothetical protein
MAIRLTETRLRQIIREEASRLAEAIDPGVGEMRAMPTGEKGSFTPEEMQTIFKVYVLVNLFSSKDIIDMGRWPGEVMKYPDDPVNQIQGIGYKPSPLGGGGGFEFAYDLKQKLRKFNIKGPATAKNLIDSIMGPGSADTLEAWWNSLAKDARSIDGAFTIDFNEVESMDLDGAIQQIKDFQGSASSRRASIRGDAVNAGRRGYTEYMRDIKKYGP